MEWIEQIANRTESITKGKMKHYGDGDVRLDKSADWVAEFSYPADAEFFIHARDDIPYLLSLIEEQRKALEWYADEKNWECQGDMSNPFDVEPEPTYHDRGERARDALRITYKEG